DEGEHVKEHGTAPIRREVARLGFALARGPIALPGVYQRRGARSVSRLPILPSAASTFSDSSRSRNSAGCPAASPARASSSQCSSRWPSLSFTSRSPATMATGLLAHSWCPYVASRSEQTAQVPSGGMYFTSKVPVTTRDAVAREAISPSGATTWRE